MKDSRNDQNQHQKSELIINEYDEENQNSYELERSDSRFEKFNYFFNENEYHIEIELIAQNKSHECRRCKTNFSFNNKLHQHIRQCRKKRFTIVDFFHTTNACTSDRIIVFRVKSDLFKDLVFRSWHFVIFFARILKNESLNKLCVDSECTMFLIDRIYLVKSLLKMKINHTDVTIRVRDIDIIIHNCFEYVHLKLFISEFTEIVKLSRQTHVVNNLRVKFLMKMNILRSEKIILNIFRREMMLSLCENLKVFIRVTSKVETKVNRIIFVERLVIISTKSIATISTRMRDKPLLDRDYLCQSISRELNLKTTDDVMTHIVRINLAAVQVCNVTNKSVIILRKARLERLMNYEKHECYATNSIEAFLATDSSWRKTAIVTVVHTAMKKIDIKEKVTYIKEKSASDIIVYDTSEVRSQLLRTIQKYSILWNKIENFTINVLDNEWMSVILKSKAKIKFVRIYSMRFKKRELIDETFDKLHQQRKMHWIIELTVHDALVFVVWRMINDERKNRVVMNIKELNKIIEFDFYSMSLQIDIISAVTKAKFISIIDVAAFFYQFRVRISDRHKLTIMSHREQKYFSIAFMSFKNSSAYAQRRINIILQDLKHCCRAFIDDITIFSSTFEKHIKHLSVIFQRLLDYDIRLNSCKAFLNFSSIALLEQHVDEFDLHAIKNKIVVIFNWKFLSTLKALKIYFEFIEWLRNYVAWYAQKIESLQQRKILLLKNSSSQREHARKAYVDRIIIDNRTTRKEKSFEMIQKTFKNSRFLTHFKIIRQFLIDVNAFKKEFEVFVYHIKKNWKDMTKSTTIESIVFLSKILTSAKKRYWSTELEVVVVVWIVKKLHHMIRASKHSTIIWTNHSITTSIVKQSKMFIFNTNKLNLRFVRVDMYLSQFDLDIRHKSKRDHVISNALSRFSFFQNDEKTMKNSDNNILNDIDAYAETLMKMSIIFKNQLIEVYKTNREWSTLYEILVTSFFYSSNLTKYQHHEKITEYHSWRNWVWTTRWFDISSESIHFKNTTMYFEIVH